MNKYISEEIRRLSQEEGLKDHEIAIAICCSRATVCRYRKLYNIPRTNYSNRRDKIYICSKCNTTYVLKRISYSGFVCSLCK